MAHIITASGETKPIKNTEFKTIQEAVGGFVQIVTATNGKLIAMDEEGKMKGKPVNAIATEMYNNPYDQIVGDVVICDDSDIK